MRQVTIWGGPEDGKIINVEEHTQVVSMPECIYYPDKNDNVFVSPQYKNYLYRMSLSEKDEWLLVRDKW